MREARRGNFQETPKNQILMATRAAVQVSGLTKHYKGAPVPAVDRISFSVEEGEVFGLLGPNGAGKTTTISVLCGLIAPTAGDVSIHGLDNRLHRKEIKHLISLVPQEIALYPTLTAYENLEYIGNMYGMKGDTLKKRIRECLELFGLSPQDRQLLETYSGGMKRRVNLIAGILHRPKVLFLDEPTVGVDVQSRSLIHEFLKDLHNQGTTIIYTSHLMEEAESLCTQLAIIDRGIIIASGVPSQLIAQHNCKNLEELFLRLTGRQLRD